MRIIIVVGSEGANPWEVLGTGPGTGCVPSKCHLFIYFADSELFFLFFILTSLKSACFLKLMACHGLNRSIFFLIVSKTIVFLKVDGIQSWWKVGCIRVLRYSTVDRKRAGIWGVHVYLHCVSPSSPWSSTAEVSQWKLKIKVDRRVPFWWESLKFQVCHPGPVLASY